MSPGGALPGPTLGSGGSGRSSLSWARPRQHCSTPGHSDWVWDGPWDWLETLGERESHSLDLSERPLLHQFHFVLALESGGGRRQQSAHPSPEGPGGPPPPWRRPLLGSLPRLDHVPPLEALEPVTEDVALGLRDTERPQRAPGRNPRALTSPRGSVGVSLAFPREPRHPVWPRVHQGLSLLLSSWGDRY